MVKNTSKLSTEAVKIPKQRVRTTKGTSKSSNDGLRTVKTEEPWEMTLKEELDTTSSESMENTSEAKKSKKKREKKTNANKKRISTLESVLRANGTDGIKENETEKLIRVKIEPERPKRGDNSRPEYFLHNGNTTNYEDTKISDLEIEELDEWPLGPLEEVKIEEPDADDEVIDTKEGILNPNAGGQTNSESAPWSIGRPYSNTPHENDFEEEEYVRNRLHILDEKDGEEFYSARSPKEVLKRFPNFLTGFEKKEILDFKKIYTIGRYAYKPQVPYSKHGHKLLTFDTNDLLLDKHDHIAYRYRAIFVSELGTFGQAFFASDRKTNKKVTVKVFKRGENQLYREAKLLLHILTHDPLDIYNCVRLQQVGTFRSHVYLVWETSDLFLHEWLCKNKPANSNDFTTVRKMGHAILSALCFLKHHHIIHANLTPTSIMLNKDDCTKLKLTDFKMAFFSSETRSELTLRTLHYLAVEAYWGIKPTEAMDMWSFGCILGDMIFKYPLLKGLSAIDQYYLIKNLLEHSLKGREFPKICTGLLRCTDAEMENWVYSYELIPGGVDIRSKYNRHSFPARRFCFEEIFQGECKEKQPFERLIKRMLTLEPEKRMTPEQAIADPLFNF